MENKRYNIIATAHGDQVMSDTKTALEYADEIQNDKEPYALKIAKELREAVGDRVLHDQAAQCLEDDCDYLKKIAESIKSRNLGNAVDLREAVELAMSVLCRNKADAPYRAWCEYDNAIEKCKSALAAPPLNCHLYADEEEARKAFLAERCQHQCGDCTVRKDKTALCHPCGIEWLFSTAKKGATDGSK